jgi:biopolymer transport protein ExbB
LEGADVISKQESDMHSLQRPRLVPAWLSLVVLAFFTFSLMQPVVVHAEGEDGAKTTSTDKSEPKSKNTLVWIAYTSGYIGAVLLAISIYFVATVLQLFMELKADVVAPPQLLADCEQLLAKRDFNGIYKAAKEDPSELGQLIATGMVGLSSGLADAREAIDRQGEVITVEMEKRISMLAVIGALGPLIGLLGTLKGMIGAFSAIALEGTQMKAGEVAGHISEALIITFEGVGLSVPAIYLFAVFKNRVATLSVQTLNVADEMIRRIHATAQKKATAAPAEAAS